MFIQWLFVNWCSMRVKLKSKAKAHGEKAYMTQFYLYFASAAEGGPSFDIYCGAMWVNARYNLYIIINVHITLFRGQRLHIVCFSFYCCLST